MFEKLSVNLGQFGDEDDDEDFSKYISDEGDLDVDSIINDYQETSSNEEENHQESEESEETSSNEEEENKEETSSNEEKPEEEKPEEEDSKNTPDQAFAEMRRKNEENEPLAKWVKEIAEKQGFSEPSELINAFEQKKLEEEAKEKGVPPDVYKRLSELEKENQQKDETMYKDRFNSEVEKSKEKHDLSDDQITEVFRFMGQRGYIDDKSQATIPFEDAYILANKDNMLEKAKQDAQQEYLTKKQKKQNQATPNVGTNKEDKTGNTDELDYSTEGIFKTLEKMGIDYD